MNCDILSLEIGSRISCLKIVFDLFVGIRWAIGEQFGGVFGGTLRGFVGGKALERNKKQ